MGITVSKEGSDNDYDMTPEGLHRAVCYGVVDMGTHPNKLNPENMQKKVTLLFELTDLRIEYTDDEGVVHNFPRAISIECTQSLADNAYLRKHLKTWRGRDFTPEELQAFELYSVIGANALVQVIHNKSKADGKVYANIESILPKPPNEPNRVAENEHLRFSFADGDTEIPKRGIMQWQKEKIMRSSEYQNIISGMQNEPEYQPPITGNAQDDIPF